MKTLSDPLLRTLAAVPVGSRILELRSSPMAHTQALSSLGFDVTVCVPSPEATNDVVEELQHVEGEHEVGVYAAETVDLPFSAQSFDWVVALDGLSFADAGRLKAQLSEIQRVLNAGGWVYLRQPNFDDGVDGTAITGEEWQDLLGSLNLAVAQDARSVEGDTLLHAIYRRVEAGVSP